MSAVTVRDEKRAERQLERMQRGRQIQVARAQKDALADAIRETRKTFPRCRCDLRRGMTRADIAALGGGCTMPVYCCPRLDAVRRRIGA